MDRKKAYHKWRGITCTNDQDKLFQMTFLGQFRGSSPEMFLVKGVVKIWSKFTGEHPCRSVISIKLQSNFIEITLRHGCFPVRLLHILRTTSSKNTSGRLLLSFAHVIPLHLTYKASFSPYIFSKIIL